jgi:hypothetical protein
MMSLQSASYNPEKSDTPIQKPKQNAAQEGGSDQAASKSEQVDKQ